MDNNRILELALETLERQKAEVEAEIEKIRAELIGTAAGQAGRKHSPRKHSAHKHGKKRHLTAEQRKVRSEKMKKYWAAKKAGSSGKKA